MMNSSDNPPVTHNQLVTAGISWLKKIGFPIVTSELKTIRSREIPDIVGFRSSSSIMIECKTSRSDFLADKKKPERYTHIHQGIGKYRLYLCPTGLINISELPSRWGLLYYQDGKIQVKHFKQGNLWDLPLDSPYIDEFAQQSNIERERSMLYSLLIRGL